MNKYIVYTLHGTVVVTAEKVNRNFMNGNPSRLVFTTKDLVVAEFYCDRIYGWMEDKE